MICTTALVKSLNKWIGSAILWTHWYNFQSTPWALELATPKISSAVWSAIYLFYYPLLLDEPEINQTLDLSQWAYFVNIGWS